MTDAYAELPPRLREVADRLRAAGCVFAEHEAAVLARAFPSPEARETAVGRRCSGEPLEYVVGTAEFAGVEVQVGPPAFLPRRRAEALVDVAVDLVAGDPAAVSVAVDLGCGCGALAAALRARYRHWRVLACDTDERALRWAARNAARFGFSTYHGDWFDALPQSERGRLDLVVAHLPYVPTRELAHLPRDFRAVEPTATVDGGPDGLDPWRRVAADAGRWLHPRGVLLVQVAASQRGDAAAIAARSGLAAGAVDTGDSVVLVVRPAGRSGRGMGGAS